MFSALTAIIGFISGIIATILGTLTLSSRIQKRRKRKELQFRLMDLSERKKISQDQKTGPLSDMDLVRLKNIGQELLTVMEVCRGMDFGDQLSETKKLFRETIDHQLDLINSTKTSDTPILNDLGTDPFDI